MGSWGGGDRIVAASPGSLGALGGVDDDDDDDEEGDEGAGACAVCREGYRLRPGELLGVYVYSKRVPLAPAAAALAAAAAPADAMPAAASAPQPRSAAARLAALINGDPIAPATSTPTSTSAQQSGPPLWGFTCVSHFNAIHVSCHAAARRADGALRPPKREWDGAATRNHGTRCNALLPLRGDGVSDNAYAAAADAYWAAVAAAAGDARETRAAAARWRALAWRLGTCRRQRETITKRLQLFRDRSSSINTKTPTAQNTNEQCMTIAGRKDPGP